MSGRRHRDRALTLERDHFLESLEIGSEWMSLPSPRRPLAAESDDPPTCPIPVITDVLLESAGRARHRVEERSVGGLSGADPAADPLTPGADTPAGASPDDTGAPAHRVTPDTDIRADLGDPSTPDLVTPGTGFRADLGARDPGTAIPTPLDGHPIADPTPAVAPPVNSPSVGDRPGAPAATDLGTATTAVIPRAGASRKLIPPAALGITTTAPSPRRRHAAPSIRRFTPARLALAGVVLTLFSGGVAWLAHPRTRVAPPAPPVVAAPPALTSPPVAAPPTTPSTAPSTTTPSTGAPAPAATAPAATEPAATGPVSLAGWKLTIPEASAKGTAANITPAVSTSPWLTRDNLGGLKFWAPVDGTTTPNSKHARTELDSLHNFTAGSGRHALSASLTISQAPAQGRDVIVGQIHGAADISSSSFVMLHWDAGTIRVAVKQVLKGPTSDSYPLFTGVPLGATFDYTLTDPGNGNVVISVTWAGRTKQTTVAIPEVFRDQNVRFQAGAYQQGEQSNGASDGALITFHTLGEQHSAG